MPPPLRAAAAFGIAYRPATDDDLLFLAALYASTRADEVAATGWPAEAQREFLAQQHRAQHHHYTTYYPDAEMLLIEREGRAVGRLYLDELPGEIRVIDISLVPDSRGGGIGEAVLRDIFHHADGLGKTVSIHVEKQNPARRLYLRLGFETVEDKGVYDFMVRRPPPSS